MPAKPLNKFVLILAAPVGEDPDESARRLRLALKALRRRHGLKCLAAREVPKSETPSPTTNSKGIAP